MAEHALLVKADPPNPAQLPQDDIVGVTVMLLTCSYNQQVSTSGCHCCVDCIRRFSDVLFAACVAHVERFSFAAGVYASRLLCQH